MGFLRCNNKLCKTCDFSEFSNDNSNSIVPFCKVSSAVYRITCNICGQCYIGQTGGELHIRMNLHRSNTKNKNLKNISFEIAHFRLHDFENISIAILAVENDLKKRLILENNLILKFHSLFPYGLNTHLSHVDLDKISCIWSFFGYSDFLKTSRGKRGTHKFSKSINNIVPSLWLANLQCSFDSCLNVNIVKSKIFTLNSKNIKKINSILGTFKFSNSQFKGIVCDLVKFRLSNIKSFDNLLYFTIDFQQKSFSNLNISKILHDNLNIFPIKNCKIIPSFKYCRTLGSILFNYRNTVLDAEDCNSCNCCNFVNTPFFDDYHKHIITGNLNFIDNDRIRVIMSYGSKFRLNKKIKYNNALQTFCKNLNCFILKLSYKFVLPLEFFSDWKIVVLNDFKVFLKEALNSNHYTYYNFSSIDKDYIRDLHSKYVICPVDKAANNFAIICKSFYRNLVIGELNDPITYTACTQKTNVLHKKFIAFFKLVKHPCPKFFSLPFLFATPKFHKSPVKFRFVCCTSNSIGKDANVVLQKYLKDIFVFLKNKYIEKCWIIDNSLDVTKAIKESDIKSVQTFDFENLFTNIPIEKLREVLMIIFDSHNIENELKISKTLFYDYCSFCLFNNFIICGNSIFLQTKGIGMGTNFSSTAANLFLFYYEYAFVLNHDDKILALRYIDDLIVFNFNFNDVMELVYPDFLKLTKTNTNDCFANYLDLSLLIKNNNILIDLYDKRNFFNFDIHYMPHWNSNLHKSIFVNVVIGQIIRFFRICGFGDSFLKSIYLFFAHLYYKNNFPINFLYFYFNTFKNSINS